MANIQEQPLMQIKATNGTVLVYDDKVVVKRTGIVAISTQGIKGDTVYFYNNLSGIEYRKPGWVNGYLRFIVPGTQTYNPTAGSIGGKNGFLKSMNDATKNNLKDPNTIVLRAFNSSIPKQSEQIYNFILKKINENNSKSISIEYVSNLNSSPSNYSGADEIAKYKALLDQGVISQEDFERKKQQILNM